YERLLEKKTDDLNETDDSSIRGIYKEIGSIGIDYYSNSLKSQDWRTYGLQEETCRSDGNCQFRAFARIVYNDENEHPRVRREICRYLLEHQDIFKHYVYDIPFDAYLEE